LERVYDSLRISGSAKSTKVAKETRYLSPAMSSSSSSPEPLLNRYEALYDEEPDSDDGPETPKKDSQDILEAPRPLLQKPDKPIARDIDLDFDVMVDDMISYYMDAFMALVVRTTKPNRFLL